MRPHDLFVVGLSYLDSRCKDGLQIILPVSSKSSTSTQLTCEVASCIRRLPESKFSSRKMAKEIGERNDVGS
jgi:hypothetical protein